MAQSKAKYRWDRANSVNLTIRIMKKTESDILQKLESVPIKAAYVKSLIRADIAKTQQK